MHVPSLYFFVPPRWKQSYCPVAGRSKLLWNVGGNPPEYMVWLPRRQSVIFILVAMRTRNYHFYSQIRNHVSLSEWGAMFETRMKQYILIQTCTACWRNQELYSTCSNTVHFTSDSTARHFFSETYIPLWSSSTHRAPGRWSSRLGGRAGHVSVWPLPAPISPDPATEIFQWIRQLFLNRPSWCYMHLCS